MQRGLLEVRSVHIITRALLELPAGSVKNTMESWELKDRPIPIQLHSM